MRPQLLIDLLGFTGERGGTETYAREIISRLPALLPHVDLVGLVGTVGADRVTSFFPGPVRVEPRVGASSTSWAWGALTATDRHAQAVGADLVWVPANFGPITAKTPRVTTIHDVIYHQVPGSIGERATRAVTSWLMERSARTSSAVIAISQTTSAAAQELLHVDPARVSVVLNGSSSPQVPAEPWAELAAIEVRQGRPIVLSTGNRMPHKNFEGLLRAIAEIPADRRPLTVIPGSHGADPLIALVEELDLSRDVVLPGWITGAQLEALFAVCAVYVCPSLVEGFGLPVVDGLRRGCAVVANDVPVLREVGGDVVTYANAEDPAFFAETIEAALVPLDEGRRAANVAWGERYTWHAAAQGTASVLEDQLNRVMHRPMEM